MSKKTETELVHAYVNKVIKGKTTRGHVDDRFAYTQSKTTVNKELWGDCDFYFSVVFQSSAQKIEFLEQLAKKFQVAPDALEEPTLQIVNGLKFAEQLGIKLKKETSHEYPLADLDLRDYILDNDTI